MPPLPNKPNPAQKPLVFGKPEKASPWQKILPWVFVVLGIGAIGWMIAHNTRQKPLTCEHSLEGSASLTTFGTCTTE